ncbi:MAG: PIN domain-containing protein [Proteobacteria bacterium]|jgi:toxin-antitoxin system PIN domain toxin|nr:PIN domain-containing protein [Pseudomonadota bacterium]
MIGIDTNIFLYARLQDSPCHASAVAFLEGQGQNRDIVISELVLLELYLLLRNERVLMPPLSPSEAVAECGILRAHPHWQLVESADVMAEVWPLAGMEGFARRKIVDVRLAKTLQAHGVVDFATANTKDFEGLGFRRVWNPLLTE